MNKFVHRSPRCRSRLVALVSLASVSFATGPALGQGTIGNFPDVVFPPGNPSSPAKIELGRALFFEEQLSTDNTMSCATCHLPAAGGADVRAGAREPGLDGVLGTPDDEFGSPGMIRQDAQSDYAHHPAFGTGRQATARNAPTVIGAAFFDSLFWDMRAGPVFHDEDGLVVLGFAAALESQAVDPPLSSIEMAHVDNDWDSVVAKLSSVRPLALASDLSPPLAAFLAGAEDYGPLFTEAFGSPEVTRERVAMAIATYERTLVPDQTPFDLGTMTPEQQAGFDLFVDPSVSSCALCHSVANGLFSDGFFHTDVLPDHFRFVKTPTLRNVGLRPRLMSSGQFSSLDETLTHYENIGFFTVPLSAIQRSQMLAFLGEALTDPRVVAELPPFDRPTLRSELEPFESNLYGAGGAGSGGIEPRMLASSPGNVGPGNGGPGNGGAGNDDFKIGIGEGLGGAPAVLLISRGPAPPDALLAGVPLNVDRRKARAITVALSGSGPGVGVATVHIPLSGSAQLAGVELFVQWFVVDPKTPGGLSSTKGARLTLF